MGLYELKEHKEMQGMEKKHECTKTDLQLMLNSSTTPLGFGRKALKNK